MSAQLVSEVSKRLAFNEAAYGKTWTGEDEDTRFLVQPLLDEAKRLRDALDRYGEHDRSCGVHLSKPCSCGLHAAMGLGVASPPLSESRRSDGEA